MFLESAYFDASTLKFADGKITGDFKIYGVTDVDTLTKDNVKIAGASVEKVEKADDNTVKLTLSADGVKSVNDFADLVCNAELTLGDYVTTVDLCQASFYPVYDYVEQDGDSLKLTVKLYADNGTFAEGLSADMITYADGLADAKTESLTRDSENLATLILTIPANGMRRDAGRRGHDHPRRGRADQPVGRQGLRVSLHPRVQCREHGQGYIRRPVG